jgi:hypothetical protein
MKFKKLTLFASLLATLIFSNLSSAQPFKSKEDLRLQDTDEDYEKLRLQKDQIEMWEDGRRSPILTRPSAHYEWWYFDGHLDDGTTIVAWFGDNWPNGIHKRVVSLEITPPGEKTRSILKEYKEAGTFSFEQADVKIGPHRFVGDLNTYSIKIDAKEMTGLGCDLVLERYIPSYRPATGHFSAGEKFFAWIVAVPDGKVSGTITVDKNTMKVAGSGYHDHNWGNTGVDNLFASWWWGRGQAGERTAIVAHLNGKPKVGGTQIPIFFIGKQEEVELNAYANQVSFQQGPLVTHPDPKHVREIHSYVTLTAQGASATFPISELLTSENLLQMSSVSYLERIAAQLLGLKPWYSRFLSHISLTLPNEEPQTGKGTLELFEMQ